MLDQFEYVSVLSSLIPLGGKSPPFLNSYHALKRPEGIVRVHDAALVAVLCRRD